MDERERTVGSEKVGELYEYKNLGVTKHRSSFSASNIDGNIEKRKKMGMIFFLDF